MTYALGVLVFVVALLVSVMLHELGHFLTAKRFGMKATRFFVGFGPTIWSTRRGETEYGVKAIPAGGFVKIVGMTPLEEVEPGDEERAFYRQPARQKLVVLAAGSITHFIIATLVLFGVIATTGDPLHARTTLTIVGTSPCVIADTDRTTCADGDPPAPAHGQLFAGDRMVAIDGRPVASYDELRSVLQASPGERVTLTVLRDGVQRDVTLRPVPVTVDGKRIGRIGVYPQSEPVPVSFGGSFGRTFSTLGTFFTSTVDALGDLPHQVSIILKDEPRQNGATSVVGISRVSGQIAEADASIGDRLANLLLIAAQVNFFVGLFNLLPLLPLDGGHIAIVGFEAVRRRVYGWFGRPDPGRVDLMKIMPVTYAVVALFVGLSVLLIYADIVNPIRLE
jgi:membrane-associated protease RseP (regulator of RpoE activity)